MKLDYDPFVRGSSVWSLHNMQHFRMCIYLGALRDSRHGTKSLNTEVDEQIGQKDLVVSTVIGLLPSKFVERIVGGPGGLSSTPCEAGAQGSPGEACARSGGVEVQSKRSCRALVKTQFRAQKCCFPLGFGHVSAKVRFEASE